MPVDQRVCKMPLALLISQSQKSWITVSSIWSLSCLKMAACACFTWVSFSAGWARYEYISSLLAETSACVCVSVCARLVCVLLLALSCQSALASPCPPLSYLTLPSLSTQGDENQSDRTHATICPSSMATSCPPRQRERLFVFAACEFVWTWLPNKGIAALDL